MVDIDLYMELSDLFRFKLDLVILTLLAEHPYRFRDLEKRAEQQVHDRIDDNTFDRGLKRLVKSGCVTAVQIAVGRRQVKLYQITDHGLARLRICEAVAELCQPIRPSQTETGQPPDPDQLPHR